MEKDLQILTESEIIKRLETLTGWKFANDKISKQYEFATFPDAIEFIHSLTPFFQNNDHHPDIHIYYKKVLFELQRFSVGGKVTPRDFMVASEIDRCYSRL